MLGHPGGLFFGATIVKDATGFSSCAIAFALGCFC
jgi:hypothetical protein